MPCSYINVVISEFRLPRKTSRLRPLGTKGAIQGVSGGTFRFFDRPPGSSRPSSSLFQNPGSSQPEVLLGELLGLYAVFPWDERGMRQRDEPLMTPEGLLAHLDALGPRKGTSRVRRALSLACVRSGSPRETKLSLRLSLKPSLGGYGLTVLSMNEPVEVGRIHDRLQRGTRRPDILVAGPERPGQERRVAAVEYNGRDHDAPARISEDARRTNELVAVGIPEFVVRREQYADLDYMDGLVERIREKLGVPRQMQSAERRAQNS